MLKVEEVIKDIKDNLKQTSASRGDEVKVMRAMLNDREYEVGVYNKEGETEKYNPSSDMRDMLTSVISSAANIPTKEANELAQAHEFKNSECESMVRVSKEFVNTYLGTGRKLPFGSRATHDVAVSIKNVPAGVTKYPKKIGVGDDGKGIYASEEKKVNAYDTFKIYGGCPTHLR